MILNDCKNCNHILLFKNEIYENLKGNYHWDITMVTIKSNKKMNKENLQF